MQINGFRHPFYGKYKAAFDDEGIIKAVDVSLFANAGWNNDLSFAVVEQAMFRSDNSYKVYSHNFSYALMLDYSNYINVLLQNCY